MIVRAKTGLLVPKLAQPRRYITDDKPVEVPEHEYYRRLVIAGDLVLVANKLGDLATPAAETIAHEPDSAAEAEKPAKKVSK